MQNAQGHLLGHVRDLGYSSDDPNIRIYQTHERQTHHTDSCDIVGLLCLRTAKSGGLSSLVSSTTIFNEMHRRRPDLLRVLMEPMKQTDVERFLKAASLISRFPSSTITMDWCRRFTNGSTSNRQDDFLTSHRSRLSRSKL